jgi:hypothetical protein
MAARAATQRSLLIHLADGAQAASLVRFLRARDCAGRRQDGSQVVVDDCDRDSPGLATLVALVEEWRCTEHLSEVALELAGRTTILRTES